jgi:hypothetical protein
MILSCYITIIVILRIILSRGVGHSSDMLE